MGGKYETEEELLVVLHQSESHSESSMWTLLWGGAKHTDDTTGENPAVTALRNQDNVSIISRTYVEDSQCSVSDLDQYYCCVNVTLHLTAQLTTLHTAVVGRFVFENVNKQPNENVKWLQEKPRHSELNALKHFEGVNNIFSNQSGILFRRMLRWLGELLLWCIFKIRTRQTWY